MTRQEEIETLLSLKGDTYFAQKFGQDIEQMCQNISNDFPIEFDCQFAAKENALQEQLKAQQAAAKDRFMSFAHDIILAMTRYTRRSKVTSGKTKSSSSSTRKVLSLMMMRLIIW